MKVDFYSVHFIPRAKICDQFCSLGMRTLSYFVARSHKKVELYPISCDRSLGLQKSDQWVVWPDDVKIGSGSNSSPYRFSPLHGRSSNSLSLLLRVCLIGANSENGRRGRLGICV